jgi:hypothetical protein
LERKANALRTEEIFQSQITASVVTFIGYFSVAKFFKPNTNDDIGVTTIFYILPVSMNIIIIGLDTIGN